jgi:hypothetical protein
MGRVEGRISEGLSLALFDLGKIPPLGIMLLCWSIVLDSVVHKVHEAAVEASLQGVQSSERGRFARLVARQREGEDSGRTRAGSPRKGVRS